MNPINDEKVPNFKNNYVHKISLFSVFLQNASTGPLLEIYYRECIMADPLQRKDFPESNIFEEKKTNILERICGKMEELSATT